MAAVAHGRGGARGTKETPPTDTPGNRSAIVFVHIRNKGWHVMANWWDGIVPPTKPRANEKLWEVWARHKLFSCELKYHGEFGVEAQIFENGDLLVGRRFDTRQLAVN